MKPIFFTTPQQLTLWLACLALLLGSAASAQTRAANPTPSRSQNVTLNFSNAEIDAVARTVATLTGRNVVVDPRVKGQMNLSTEKAVSPQSAFNQFLSALRLQGFTVVESGGLYKVVPEADAKLQGGDTTVAAPGESVRAAGNQIVTQIFRLNYETANNLVPILRPLISPNNTINVNPGTNALIITDYSENLSRMARIIAALDVSSATDLEIIPLKHAQASELAPLITRLVDASSATGAVAAAGGTDATFRTTILAENRSNALIIRAANPARLALTRSLISQLDQAPAGSNPNGAAGNIHVVYLKNADATRLAITLRAALQASNAATQSTGGLQGGNLGNVGNVGSAINTAASANPGTAPIAASAQPSTGGQIQADPATNSLIITANETQMRQIKAVIEKLDTRRAQVFVETLIAEVNSDKAASFGVQWQNVLGNTGLGTNFGAIGNLASLSTSIAAGTAAAVNRGINIAAVERVGGKNQLGFLANFLETTGDGNVLSTPNLLTLDNEEAKIVVGQNVPFLTGQFTNSTSGGATNPFQTIERKDVGITLRVKPQINENGTIKLTIFQEVSSVQASSVNSASGLTTNKRSIESNVLVEDGSVVVLGGLLQDEGSANQERIPGLGNIPFFGALFRSDVKSRKKTNLMVFLRPVIVRDGLSSENLSLSRYEQMRVLQEEPKAMPNSYGSASLPENPLQKTMPLVQTPPSAIPAPATTRPTR